MEKYNFVVFGGATSHFILKVDNIAKEDETIYLTNNKFDQLYFGGTGLNIAYSLGKLGDNNCKIVGLTNRKYGSVAKEALEKVGVDTEYLEIIEGSATSYIIEDMKGKRLTILSKEISPTEICRMPKQLFGKENFAILSVGSKNNTKSFLDKLIEFDTPFAFSMRSDRVVFNDDLLRQGMPKAEIIFCNEFEKRIIENALELESIGDIFSFGKAKAINVTEGEKGSTLYLRGEDREIHINPIKNVPVIDCTGAGDAFVAGFMFGVSKGFHYKECAKLGSTMSSFIIEHLGCVTGSPSQEQLFERYYEREDVEKENFQK